MPAESELPPLVPEERMEKRSDPLGDGRVTDRSSRPSSCRILPSTPARLSDGERFIVENSII